MKLGPLTEEEYRRWRRWRFVLPRPPRAGLALTIVGAAQRVKHWWRGRRRMHPGVAVLLFGLGYCALVLAFMRVL